MNFIRAVLGIDDNNTPGLQLSQQQPNLTNRFPLMSIYSGSYTPFLTSVFGQEIKVQGVALGVREIGIPTGPTPNEPLLSLGGTTTPPPPRIFGSAPATWVPVSDILITAGFCPIDLLGFPTAPDNPPGSILDCLAVGLNNSYR